jgi:hypothetical protein
VDPVSGMEKIRIRDGKKSDSGSGINIPDPQHWLKHTLNHEPDPQYRIHEFYFSSGMGGGDSQLIIDESGKAARSRKAAASREKSLKMRLSVAGPQAEPAAPLSDRVSYPQIGNILPYLPCSMCNMFFSSA